MKLFLDDILKISWAYEALNKVKSPLLNYKNGGYFVIYYKYNDVTSEIDVVSSEILYIINEDIYRKLSRTGGEYVGYFYNSFETNSILFYNYFRWLIKTAFESDADKYKIVKKSLSDLFLFYKNEDIKSAKVKSQSVIKGTFPITSSASLENALQEIYYINKKPIDGLKIICEALNTYFLNKNNISFYGDVLRSFVRLVKNPNGGIINEANGTIRYLIIGEKVAGNDPTLIEAKDLLRKGVDIDSIYLTTGWYFNKFDSKWRKNVDNKIVKYTSKVEFTDNYILAKDDRYSPSYSLYDDLKSVNSGQLSFIDLIKRGYQNRVADIIDFDVAYQYYPKLKEIYSVLVGGSNGEFSDEYYFSDSLPQRIVLMRGTIPKETVIYVGFHEIQHYVQHIEGFGNGGNLYLAELINTVGGENTREFVNTLNSFEKDCSNIESIDLQGVIEYLEALKTSSSPEVIQAVTKLQSYCTSLETFKINSSSFAYSLINLYCFDLPNKIAIKKLVNKFFNPNYDKLFDYAFEQSRKRLEQNQNLLNKGWTARDIWMLNFQTYQALLGEVESRFVQQTEQIDEELKSYFSLYSAETIDPKKVTVINEGILHPETNNIKAAIEQVGSYYIIHLPDEYSNTINILHELGHIIYDIMCENQILNPIDPEIYQEATEKGYKSSEEYICDSFVDFIHRKNVELGLTEDLNDNRTITNFDTFDPYFDSIVFGNQIKFDARQMKNKINFVNKILSIIENE